MEKLKKKGDNAFNEGDYKKAYEIFNKALMLDDKNYDLIASYIGTALNLGLFDEVLQKTEILIEIDDKKPQVIWT